MRKLLISLPACALAVLTALSGSTALAQNDRWFQVELLAFANQSSVPPVGAALAEQWDATPALTYPNASRFLVDPEQVAKNSAEFRGESLLDEYGRQIIGSTVEMGETPRPLTPVFDGPVPVTSAPALPRPFVMLPRSYQEFSGKAALMRRNGSYSILFHETWVQPVRPEKSSLPIVLDRSGNEQQWPRLQGSIKIFLSRYLHLETNLWLNTAGDYLPGTWRMPAPPFGPRSLIIEDEEVVDIGLQIEELQAGMPPAAGSAAAEAAIEASGDSATAEAATLPGANPLANELAAETYAEPAGPVYSFRHAVLLQQKRRMRSSEVHYVDHPLMGLIIKFTPVSAEQLAEISAAQETSLQASQ